MAKCQVCNSRNAKGNPPLCDRCFVENLRESAEDGILGQFLAHPTVQGAFDRVAEKASTSLDRGLAAAMGWVVGKTQNKQQKATTKQNTSTSREVLGFSPTEPLDKAKIKSRKKALAAIFHADKGGNDAAMQRVNLAADELLKTL